MNVEKRLDIGDEKLPAKVEKNLNFLRKAIDWVITTDSSKIKAYVDKLRDQNPGISNDALAKKIVKRKSLKCGLFGAVTGVGGLITLPITVPTNLRLTWRTQAIMAAAIAYVYGHTEDTTDLKTDMYLIMAGNQATEALKRIGIEAGKVLTKKAVQNLITRDIMVKIWSVVGRKIITKAGEKSLTSFMRMVPLVGAPIGFAFDWAFARTVGHFAIKYYSGKE